MSKLARCLALVAAMSAVSVAALSVADAQEKGKAAGKTTGIVEVGEGKDGKFRFTVRDNDGKYLAQGGGPTGFATKDDALKAVEKLKAALENPKITTGKKAAGGKDKDKGTGKE